MARDFHILEPGVGVAVVVLRFDDKVGGNRVSWGKLVEDGGRLDLVRHGHGVHEAGDGLAVDNGGLVLRVDGDDTAGEGVALCGRRLGVMAGGNNEYAREDEED